MEDTGVIHPLLLIFQVTDQVTDALSPKPRIIPFLIFIFQSVLGRSSLWISGSEDVPLYSQKSNSHACAVESINPLTSLCLFFAEYAESIGDGKSDEFKEAERKRIMDLVDNF